MEQFCVFGDSVAKGVVYDTIKDKYVLAKECCVNLFQRATGFIVRNYSRFGSTILKGSEMVGKHVDELPEYDRVVLEFGSNDSDYHWDEIAADPDALHLPNVELHVFREEYGKVIDNIRENNGTPVMTTIAPIHAPRFFNWISRGLDADNILYWLGGDESFTYRWQEMYNLAICKLAVEKDVPLIDIRGEFLKRKNYEDFLCEDGMHPNDLGHQLISEALCAYWEQASA